MQTWPALRNLQRIAPATALSSSASSKTRKGALPPSSSESFMTWPAHCAMRILPTAVEPVNASLRTSGLPVSSPPIAGASSASPVTTWKTPAGMPGTVGELGQRERRERRLLGGLADDRVARCERRRDLARDHGRREVPGRDAAADPDRLLQHDDPGIGRLRGNRVAVDALALLAHPLKEGGGVPDLASDSASGLPCSRVMIIARSRRWRSMRSEKPRRYAARSRAGRARQAGSAAAAASIARRVSAAPIRGTSASTSPRRRIVHRERRAGVGARPRRRRCSRGRAAARSRRSATCPGFWQAARRQRPADAGTLTRERALPVASRHRRSKLHDGGARVRARRADDGAGRRARRRARAVSLALERLRRWRRQAIARAPTYANAPVGLLHVRCASGIEALGKPSDTPIAKVYPGTVKIGRAFLRRSSRSCIRRPPARRTPRRWCASTATTSMASASPTRC